MDEHIPRWKVFRVDHIDYKDRLFFTKDYDEKFNLIENEACDVQEFLESDLNFAKTLYPEFVYDLGFCKSWRELWKKSIESDFTKESIANHGAKKRHMKKSLKGTSKEAFLEGPAGWDRDFTDNFAIWPYWDEYRFEIGRYETINGIAKQKLIDEGGYDWRGFAVFVAKDKGVFYVNFEVKQDWSKERENEFFKWIESDDPGPVIFNDLLYAKDLTDVYTGKGNVGHCIGFNENKIDMDVFVGADYKNSDYLNPHRYAVFTVDREWTVCYREVWKKRKAEQDRIVKEAKLNFARMVLKDRSNNLSMEAILEKISSSDLVSEEALELIAKAYDPVGMVYKNAYQDEINRIRGESHWTFGTSIQTIEDPETGLLRLATGTKGASFLLGVTQSTVRNRFNKGKLAGIKNDSIWIWLDTIKDSEEFANVERL